MAVTSYVDISYRAGGKASQEGPKSDSTLVFLVELDDYNTSLASIASALGVTLYVTPNPYNPLEVCTGVDVEFVPEHRLLRQVSFRFTNIIDEKEKQDQQNENPLDRPLKITGRRQQYQKPIVQDITGAKFTNSAGELFEKVSIDAGRWVHQFEINLYPIPIWVRTYADKLNSAPVSFLGLSFAAKTLKFVPLDYSELKFENFQFYHTVRFELHEREEGWQHKEVDRGFMGYDSATDAPKDASNQPVLSHIRIPFFDSAGTRLKFNDARRRPVTKPYPIDVFGNPIDDPSTEDPEILSFDVYQTAAFNVIPGVS